MGTAGIRDNNRGEGDASLFGRALLVLAAGYLVLALFYAAVTPVFEKPDEQWHFAFSMYLVEEGRLPVQSLEARDHLAEQEGSQPPFYYALLAGLLRVTGLTELGAGYVKLTEVNPYHGGRPGAWLDNANLFARGPCDAACQRTTLAVFLGRGLSVLFGLVAVVAAAQAVRLAFPTQPYVPLAVAGILAFNPQFLHISSSVSNDVPTVALVNLAFVLGIGWLYQPGSAMRVVGLGIAVALATLTKPSGLAIVVTMGLLLLLGAPLAWPRRLRNLALYGSTFALLTGWWFTRNLRLYGEPTATRIHLAVYGEPAPELTWSRFVAEWKAVGNSYWASFGWGGINLPDQIYLLGWTISFVLLALSIVSIRRDWRGWSRQQRALVGLSCFHLVLVALLMFQWMRLTVAPLGRLLFPAALPLALLLGLGLVSLVPQRWRQALVTVSVGAWSVVALALALILVRPAYAPAASLASLPESAMPVNARFGEEMVLEGYEAPMDPLAPGDVAPLVLYWRPLRPIEEQLTVAIKVFGRDGQVIAEDHSYPDAGRWPTTSWQPGEIIPDRRNLLIAASSQVPAVGRVEIDVFREEDLEWLPVVVEGEDVRPFRPVALVVRGEDDVPAQPDPFVFRPVVEDVAVVDDEVEVGFVWEIGQQLPGDYHAFFHLTAAIDQPPIAQDDFEPLGGGFPTGYWWPGDKLRERARLPLPDDAPEGDYLLTVGLYDLATGKKIPGEGHDDVWVMGSLHWSGEEWTAEFTPSASR
jgi:hypothetical protein